MKRSNPLGVRLEIRISVAQLDALQRHAEERGEGLSEWIRQALATTLQTQRLQARWAADRAACKDAHKQIVYGHLKIKQRTTIAKQTLRTMCTDMVEESEG